MSSAVAFPLIRYFPHLLPLSFAAKGSVREGGGG
jgi:hypothetical protein